MTDLTEKNRNLGEKLEEQGFVLLLFSSFLIFTFFGIGSPILFPVIGIILCIGGISEGEVHTDLWMLVPMTAGVILCGISSFFTYGNFTEGYTGLMALYPVLYLTLSYLDQLQSRLLAQLCIFWSEIVAAAAILSFLYEGFQGNGLRAGGIIGNPNALGMFLVLGWFAILRERKSGKQEEKPLYRAIVLLEPLILAALSLTLSMGSFLSLCAGMIVYLWQERKRKGTKKKRSFGKVLKRIIPLTGEMSLCIGTGILLFLGENKTDYFPVVLLPVIYLVLLCMYHREIKDFFRKHLSYGWIFTGLGLCGGLVTLLLRQSAKATFAERIEMMKNGLGYFYSHPLTGVGSYRWRVLNYMDGDQYFNTNHIHNILIHFGAELGILAVIILLIIFGRSLLKKKNRRARPALTAFIVHNLMDTSFFYFADTTMLLFTNHRETGKETKIGKTKVRILYSLFILYFIYSFVLCLKINL